jgi:hypothetical protein
MEIRTVRFILLHPMPDILQDHGTIHAVQFCDSHIKNMNVSHSITSLRLFSFPAAPGWVP